MIFHRKRPSQKVAEAREKTMRLCEPHRHFVWFPTVLETDDIAVMQWIWRKGIYSMGEWVFLYGESKEDVQ